MWYVLIFQSAITGEVKRQEFKCSQVLFSDAWTIDMELAKGLFHLNNSELMWKLRAVSVIEEYPTARAA